MVASDFEKPNGLAFSPDESKLYIVDTGATHVENGPRHIRVFDVAPDGASLKGKGKVFATCDDPTTCDEIVPNTAGAVDTPPFPWQNRGTFHQIDEIPGHR